MTRLFVHAWVCLALTIYAGCATSHHLGDDLGVEDLAGSGAGDMIAGGLSVMPNPINVVTSGAQQTVALTVTSTAAGKLTSGVTFTLADPTVGTVSGGGTLTINAGLTRGEQTSVTASYGGHAITVPLIIKLIAPDLASAQAPANASAYFGGSSGGPQPAWLYPLKGSMMPPNYGAMTLQWSGPPGVTPLVQRVQMQCPTYQQTVYLGPAACANVSGAWQCQYTPTRAQWLNLTYSCKGSDVGLTVTTSPGIGMPVGSDGPQTFSISPEDLSGAMYYLNYVNSSSTAIYRIPAGADQPVVYMKNGNTYGCAGCHSLSRDGSMVVAGFNSVYQGGGEPLGLVNGKNGGTYLIRPPGLGTYDFSTFSPMGDMLLVNALGNLTILETAHGTTLLSVPMSLSNGRLAQPDWSPDGRTIALVQTATGLANDYELDIAASSIVIMPFNSAQPLNAGTLGLPTPIAQPSAGKECNFYPAFSPDSQWVIYNSAPGGTGTSCNVHNGQSAQNSLLQIVSAQFGATPVILYNARFAMNTAAKYPRFVPSAQKNGRLLFFTFSSQLPYGFLEPMNINNPTSQIWMAAIDLDKLQKQPGVDPSYAPFWVPGQSLTSSNFAGQWTANVACLGNSDCPASYTCTGGTCTSLLQ